MGKVIKIFEEFKILD